jgi:putative MATE family efflux protein
LFSNKDLKNLILPLFMEQLLLMLVGIVDTFVISYAGESAVSGVSLVNSFNTIFIYLFTALAAGGGVIISQYIGKQNDSSASEASSQLLTVSVIFSVIITILILMENRILIHLLFGRVSPDVMKACVTYLKISAYSYPALAIYNAGAALYRSISKTKTTMHISIIANIINAIGSVVGVLVLKAGVAGVAYPSLIARSFSAIAITFLCFYSKNAVHYKKQWIFQINKKLLARILNIAIPNGIESGFFQFVKVALSSVVALFGTYQIAANGIAQSIWSLASLVCVTMGPVFITVIGQNMGAGNIPMAEHYFNKLLKITIMFSLLWNILIFILTPVMMMAYNLESETKHLIIILVLIHNICSSVFFPIAEPLGSGLRATGDVKFTMIITIATTIGIRLVFSILLGIVLKLGVIGIAYAMCLDWIIRAIIFYIRLKSGKWKKYQLI